MKTGFFVFEINTDLKNIKQIIFQSYQVNILAGTNHVIINWCPAGKIDPEKTVKYQLNRRCHIQVTLPVTRVGFA